MIYSEKEILEVVNTKNKVLYKRLYDTYYASLCHYASKLLRSTVSEEDVVQDVFLKFWETRAFFKDQKALTTYLYRAVYNACLNLIRDRKEMDREMSGEKAEESGDSHERLLIEEEYFRQIYLAIESLPAQRRLIIQKTLEGKKMEDIAGDLNISVNTVKTLKRKAYHELREKLPLPVFCFLVLLLFPFTEI